MKPRALIPLALALITITAVPADAQDADFTLVVPVRMISLHPDLESFQVLCHLLKADGTRLANPGHTGNYVSVLQPDADGNFDDDVTIELDYPGLGDDEKLEAVEYYCRIYVSNGGTFTGPRPVENDPTWMRPKPGEPFTVEVTGPLNQGG